MCVNFPEGSVDKTDNRALKLSKTDLVKNGKGVQVYF